MLSQNIRLECSNEERQKRKDNLKTQEVVAGVTYRGNMEAQR